MMQESRQPEYESAFVEVDGARVHYLHAGSGPPMLLIHGLVGSSGNWRNNIAALAEHASVYAIDLVNMGKSQRVAGVDASLRATARRILAIMDALGLREADLVGHSHGGAVSLMLAALYPRRVRRLILFAPANPYSSASDMMVRVYSTPWGGLLARLLPYLPSPIQRLALGEIYGGRDRVGDRCLREVVEGLRNPGTLLHVLCIIRSWVAEMSTLKRVLRRVARIPTLLVWGDYDATVSLASGRKLQRRLRRSQLVIVPGGHSVFDDTPELANRIVLEWMVRNPVSRPHAGRPRRGAVAARSAARVRGLAVESP